MRAFFILAVVAILAVAGWLAWALLLPVTPAAQTLVLLHSGYSTRRIASELKNAGVIRSRDAFILLNYLNHRRSLKAGEYLFERPATAMQVQERLMQGDVYVRTVVIPEGFNMFDIAQAVESAGLGSAEDFLKVAASGSLISDIAPDATSLEGYLFPNTYGFTRTQSMQEIAGAMVRQFRQTAGELGLTTDVQRTVVLASIVEKESAVAEERPAVASVYDNRLKRNMPLQADPTVIYAERLQGAYSGALHHNDMQFASAYNTYTHAGLPPGPICNPGQSALAAAMHPATTDYLYFVSDGNGHHRFSKDLEEHNRNVAAYRKVMSGR
ncbi:MAG TPA: endolytic transglycosylase MltG [Terriglobales bacterium]